MLSSSASVLDALKAARVTSTGWTSIRYSAAGLCAVVEDSAFADVVEEPPFAVGVAVLLLHPLAIPAMAASVTAAIAPLRFVRTPRG